MPRRVCRWAPVLGCAVALIGSAPAAGAALPSRPMSAADTRAVAAQVRKTYDAIRRERTAPGLYVGVWDPRRGVFLRAYGAARRSGAAATIRDSLRIGSITKTFTATVILQLVHEGRLALDQPVERYAPDLVTRFPQLRGLTLRQLLSMHSGLPDYLNVPGGIVAQIVQDPSRVWKPEELIAGGLAGDVQPPGTAGYSTTNYIVLQEIAEQVTGLPLRDLIAQRIVRPLGLTHTVLPAGDDSALPAPAAHGYLNAGCSSELRDDGATGPRVRTGTDTTTWNASYGQGGGGMTSTVGDLGRWAASMSGNTTLPTPLAALRTKDRSISDGLSYGLEIMNVGRWYGHEGEAIGWEGIALHQPTTGGTFVGFTNACNGTSLDLLGLPARLYPKANGPLLGR